MLTASCSRGSITLRLLDRVRVRVACDFEATSTRIAPLQLLLVGMGTHQREGSASGPPAAPWWQVARTEAAAGAEQGRADKRRGGAAEYMRSRQRAPADVLAAVEDQARAKHARRCGAASRRLAVAPQAAVGQPAPATGTIVVRTPRLCVVRSLEELAERLPLCDTAPARVQEGSWPLERHAEATLLRVLGGHSAYLWTSRDPTQLAAAEAGAEAAKTPEPLEVATAASRCARSRPYRHHARALLTAASASPFAHTCCPRRRGRVCSPRAAWSRGRVNKLTTATRAQMTRRRAPRPEQQQAWKALRKNSRHATAWPRRAARLREATFRPYEPLSSRRCTVCTSCNPLGARCA